MEEAAIASRQANWNGVLAQQCHWKPSKIHQKLNFLEFGERYTLRMADSPSSGRIQWLSYPSWSIACVDAGGDRNVGAETVASLLEDDQLTVVVCSGRSKCDLEKLTVADCATIPLVIHSVERQETLVLDDAVSESPFNWSLHSNQQTRSSPLYPFSIKASWSASFI